MGEHARLSPSAASRWMVCPAAPGREAGKPDTSSIYAEWGTLCHKMLANEPLEAAELEKFTPEAIEEMHATAQVVRDYIAPMVSVSAEADHEVSTYPGVAIGRDDCWGTADVVLRGENWIEVIDLKTGAGKIVEPNDPQLLLYGLGVLHHWYGPFQWADIHMKLTIVQPRAYHEKGPIRSIEMTGADLMQWAETVFRPAAERTDDPNAPAIPSEAGCFFCKAKATCREHAQAALSAAQAVFSPVGGTTLAIDTNRLLREPHELTIEEIRLVLDNEKLITGFLSAVRDYAAEQLKTGALMTTDLHYKLVAGRGDRDWIPTGQALVKALKKFTKANGKKLGKGDLYVEKFVSPAQAEKKIKPVVSAETWESIAALITKKPGNPTLAPESDPRPALLLAPQQVFKPVELMPHQQALIKDTEAKQGDNFHPWIDAVHVPNFLT